MSLAPPPTTSADFTAMIARLSGLNSSLLAYLYSDAPSADVRAGYSPFTRGCLVKHDCYCFHVKGDMSRSANPEGWRRCYEDNSGVVKTCDRGRNWGRKCGCLSGPSCLFSDMRPAKLLAVITAARAAGVTHIIEEGRFGGLSAYIYSLHGFDVTSVEFLPLDGPSSLLRELAPTVRQLDGNGRVLLPALVGNLTDAEARRTMVVFDGEKRFMAWGTYQNFRARIALAVFDDTNVKGRAFKSMLARTGQVWFNTEDAAYAEFIKKEQPGLGSKLAPLRGRRGLEWFGGVDALERYHLAIVKGGGWRHDHELRVTD